MLLYCWSCDFRGLKVSQGNVRTMNRWGGMPNHLSMAYWALFVPQITGSGQRLLKLSLLVGWYPFLRHSVVWVLSKISTSDCSQWSVRFRRGKPVHGVFSCLRRQIRIHVGVERATFADQAYEWRSKAEARCHSAECHVDMYVKYYIIYTQFHYFL